ncbi:MAG: hypothetical protein ACRDDF_07130 [Aeromonas sp.]
MHDRCSVRLSDLSVNLSDIATLQNRIETLEQKVTDMTPKLESLPDLHLLSQVLLDPLNPSHTSSTLETVSKLLKVLSSEISQQLSARTQVVLFNIPERVTIDAISRAIRSSLRFGPTHIKRLRKQSPSTICPILLSFASEDHAASLLDQLSRLQHIPFMKSVFARKSLTALERRFVKRAPSGPLNPKPLATPNCIETDLDISRDEAPQSENLHLPKSSCTISSSVIPSNTGPASTPEALRKPPTRPCKAIQRAKPAEPARKRQLTYIPFTNHPKSPNYPRSAIHHSRNPPKLPTFKSNAPILGSPVIQPLMSCVGHSSPVVDGHRYPATTPIAAAPFLSQPTSQMYPHQLTNPLTLAYLELFHRLHYAPPQLINPPHSHLTPGMPPAPWSLYQMPALPTPYY